MPLVGRLESRNRILRAALIGALIALASVLVIAIYLFLQDLASPRSLWQARLGFLLVLEYGYGAIALALVVVMPILAVWLLRERKRGRARSVLPRLLLLCGSLVVVFVLSEAIAAVWWIRSHRTTPLPIGGLNSPSGTEDEPRLPVAFQPVELPHEFPERAEDGSVEILVVGESSAAGVPYDWWLSIGNVTAWQLQKIIPGRKFQFTILASSGDTLQGQFEKLGGLKRRPDLVIIYAGHNEFTARFPWTRQISYYTDGDLPGLWETTVTTVEGWSPLCRMIREEINKCRVAIPPPLWTFRKLIDVPAFTQEELAILTRDFEQRLDAMVSFAEGIKALPILILPPGNDFDYEPNRSVLSPEATRQERARFERAFLEAKGRERTDPAGSLAAYRALLDRHPGFAELHFRLARLLAKEGRWDEAYHHATQGRDLDGFPGRCLTVFQDIYRKVAAGHRCTLIDSQEYFHKIGYHGLLDDHLFHDAIHPSLRGQVALAQAVLQAIHDRRALGWPENVPPVTIDPGDCATHFRLTPFAWEKVCNFGIMFYDLTESLRYDPSERIARRVRFGSALERIKAGELPEAVGLPNVGIPEPVPLVPGTVGIPPQSAESRLDHKPAVGGPGPTIPGT
jgi:hypothetical protein